jgi:hypothetical protein
MLAESREFPVLFCLLIRCHLLIATILSREYSQPMWVDSNRVSSVQGSWQSSTAVAGSCGVHFCDYHPTASRAFDLALQMHREVIALEVSRQLDVRFVVKVVREVRVDHCVRNPETAIDSQYDYWDSASPCPLLKPGDADVQSQPIGRRTQPGAEALRIRLGLL